MDPPVSEPMATVAKSAATAAAEPPDDPPGTRDVSSGFRVGPKAEFSVEEPMANSSRLVLPTNTAPAAARRSTTDASYGGFQPSSIREEHVVGTPRVHRLSFSAIVTPASGPGSSPAATRRSMSAARARAASCVTRLNAWISASREATRARCSSSTSAARSEPERTPAAVSTAVRGVTGRSRGSAGRGSGAARRPEPWRAPRHDPGSAARRRGA
ncbi:unannotated protein [freshwater metagenome]|uniref:Unannotated protein n=1 Tax=freshwater metagenome TaxID=449393 RepID=A0A6J7EWN3_9ZZZZ